MQVWMVLLIIAVVIIAVLAILYFVGNKLQKKQEAQRAQLESAAQMYSMLVIDKKKIGFMGGRFSEDGHRPDSKARQDCQSTCGKSKDRAEDHSIVM